MTFYVENETEFEFEFDIQEIFEKVATKILDMEGCPYETQVDLTITDNAGIWAVNKEFRQIDRPTDVLSFPNIPFSKESDFEICESNIESYFDPDSGELLLGDIMISYEKVLEQAANYGHSILREFAFLVAHSMLHLCGYDHETSEQAYRMEAKQTLALEELNITREI